MSKEDDIILAHLQEENEQRKNFFECNKESLIESAFKISLCFAGGNKIFAAAKNSDLFLAQKFVSLMVNGSDFPPLPAFTLEINSSEPDETQTSELLNRLDVLANPQDILLVFNTAEFSNALLALIRQAHLKNITIIIFGYNAILDLPNQNNLLFLYNPNRNILNKAGEDLAHIGYYYDNLQTQDIFFSAAVILSKLINYFLFENPQELLKAIENL